MATIKIETVVGAQTHTVMQTVSNANAARFVAGWRIILNMTSPSITDAQVHEAWARSILKESMERARATEIQKGRDTADAGVAPIALT